MEYLYQLASNALGNPDDPALILALVFGLAVMIFILAMMVIIMGVYNPLRKRLLLVSGGQDESMEAAGTIAKVVQPVQGLVLPQKEEEKSKVRTKLSEAGYRSTTALTTFYGTKIILAISFGGLVAIAAPFFPKYTIQEVGYAVLIASFIGLVLPNYILDKKVKKRKEAIINGFPDALDLLVICTEAGLGLNAAIQRVTQELGISYPELMEELEMVNAETRAGVDRITALRNLADRTGIDQIKGLVSLLTQSLRFGTSVGETLRIYSEEFRDKREQKAEEEAAKIATKMIFPLVFCLFPAFFVVAIGPAILGVIKAFK